MSTRCQIEFKDGYSSATIYRHSDGYPDTEHGVIQALKDFADWNKGRNDDAEYAAANFIYWSKKQLEKEDFMDEEYLRLGYGVCNKDEFHGDIEYYYELTFSPKGIEIKVYKVNGPADLDHPVTRDHFKLMKTVRLKESLG